MGYSLISFSGFPSLAQISVDLMKMPQLIFVQDIINLVVSIHSQEIIMQMELQIKNPIDSTIPLIALLM